MYIHPYRRKKATYLKQYISIQIICKFVYAF